MARSRGADAFGARQATEQGQFPGVFLRVVGQEQQRTGTFETGPDGLPRSRRFLQQNLVTMESGAGVGKRRRKIRLPAATPASTTIAAP